MSRKDTKVVKYGFQIKEYFYKNTSLKCLCNLSYFKSKNAQLSLCQIKHHKEFNLVIGWFVGVIRFSDYFLFLNF